MEENKRLIVAVYTSCNQAGGAFIARASGKDAIRVAGLYICKTENVKGIIKNKRVNRSGEHTDISQRLISRIVSTTLELSNTGCCEHCNAPLFKSKKDNLVCSEICWSK